MTRTDAIARARQHLHSGEFLAELDRRVAYQTESQNPERRDALRAYLVDELTPAFAAARFLDTIDRIAERQESLPAGGISRKLIGADRADVRARRCRRRHGRRMARQPRSVADDDSRQSRLRPRHRRQQGPAQHQSVGASGRARGARRPARLQCQIHRRDRRGDRVAGFAPGLRIAARGAERPICFWHPTGRGWRPIAPPSSSAAAADCGFIST